MSPLSAPAGPNDDRRLPCGCNWPECRRRVPLGGYRFHNLGGGRYWVYGNPLSKAWPMSYHKLAALRAFHTGRPHSVVRLPNGKMSVRLHALTSCVVVLATYH